MEKKKNGRPIKYDRVKEANELNEWSLKDDSITLLAFSSDRGYPSEYLSVWAKETEMFSQTLKVTKERIAVRREQMVSKGLLYAGSWQRCASLYDSSLFNHERKEKEFEYNLKNKEENVSVNLSDLKTLLSDDKLKQE